MAPDLIRELVRVYGLIDAETGECGLQEGVEAFLGLLELPDDAETSEYHYATFDGNERDAATAVDRSEIVTAAASSQTVKLGRGDAPLRYDDTEMTVELFTSSSEPDVSFGYRLWVDPVQFVPHDASDTSVAEHARQVAALVAETHEKLSVFYAYGYGVTGWREEAFHPDRTAIADGHIDRLYWLNLFSPEMVDGLRRGRLTNGSAWSVEELDSGSVLLLTHENPRSWDDRYADVAEELGLDPIV